MDKWISGRKLKADRRNQKSSIFPRKHEHRFLEQLYSKVLKCVSKQGVLQKMNV